MVCALICQIPSGVTQAESNWDFTNIVSSSFFDIRRLYV